jgi:hypothetical protein
VLLHANAPHFQSSSPRMRGSSITETAMIEPKSRGVLDTRWSLSSGSPQARPGGGYDGLL